MYSFPASPLTHAIILFSITAPTWYTYLTFRRTPRKALALSVGATLWGALMFGVCRFGWGQQLTGDIPLPLFTLLVPLTLGIVFRRWLVGEGLDQRWLVGLQVFRIIGGVFLIELGSGYLSSIFAHAAGWGDLLVGASAIAVLLRYRGRPIPRSAVLLVAILGILDFAGAFFFGTTSSDVPFQLFSFDQPNQVQLYPTGMIPFFLVPYACIFHVLSLTQESAKPPTSTR